jgi:hypothetical protein
MLLFVNGAYGRRKCIWLATGQWFSPSTSVSSTNKIDRQDITDILLKLALTNNTPKHTPF